MGAVPLQVLPLPPDLPAVSGSPTAKPRVLAEGREGSLVLA